MADHFQWWSALDTATAVRSGAVSASEVVEAAILRIERLDPQLGAVVIPLFERARQVDSGLPGTLFGGVPMLLKDAGRTCRRVALGWDVGLGPRGVSINVHHRTGSRPGAPGVRVCRQECVPRAIEHPTKA